jgi:predicted acylesterase/phospholipase RssA
MSGGSNDAVWEAGVLWGLSHYSDPAEFYWDVISGVSAGSINTSLTAGWKPNEVVAMTERMSDLYYELKESDLFARRPNLSDMNQAHAVLNDDPALAFLREVLAEKTGYGRMVSAGALEVNSGEFWAFNHENTRYEDFAQAALASASIPFALQPQHFHDGILVDGGTVWDINIFSAISWCRTIAEHDEDITVDIINVHEKGLPHTNTIGKTKHNWSVHRNIHGFWRDALNYHK